MDLISVFITVFFQRYHVRRKSFSSSIHGAALKLIKQRPHVTKHRCWGLTVVAADSQKRALHTSDGITAAHVDCCYVQTCL